MGMRRKGLKDRTVEERREYDDREGLVVMGAFSLPPTVRFSFHLPP